MTAVERFRTHDAPPGLLAELHRGCRRAFGRRFSPDDWEHALGGEHLVVRAAGRVVSHAAVVPRTLRVGDRTVQAGYVEAVATWPGHQGQRLGSAVMFAVAQVLAEAYEMGALSTERQSFYARLGWQRWAGRSYVLRGDERVASPDDDGGIMVLRLGPSADVDLRWSIGCEARAGDDW